MAFWLWDRLNELSAGLLAEQKPICRLLPGQMEISLDLVLVAAGCTHFGPPSSRTADGIEAWCSDFTEIL